MADKFSLKAGDIAGGDGLDNAGANNKNLQYASDGDEDAKISGVKEISRRQIEQIIKGVGEGNGRYQCQTLPHTRRNMVFNSLNHQQYNPIIPLSFPTQNNNVLNIA